MIHLTLPQAHIALHRAMSSYDFQVTSPPSITCNMSVLMMSRTYIHLQTHKLNNVVHMYLWFL